MPNLKATKAMALYWLKAWRKTCKGIEDCKKDCPSFNECRAVYAHLRKMVREMEETE